MTTEDRVIRLERAENLKQRLIGLLGRQALARDHGLLISPCNQVHTCFMRFPIDVVFLDKTDRVLRVCAGLTPWRLSPLVFRARSVLELAAGVSDGITVGQQLRLQRDTVHLGNPDPVAAAHGEGKLF